MWNILFLSMAIAGALCEDPEVHMNAEQLITSKGYPFEAHQVITADGYILEIHRIPHSKNEAPGDVSKPVMFVQHGLFSSSEDWLVNLENQSIAFVLADAGFDVWLGNIRGNQYGMRHVDEKFRNSSAFWDFSWQDFAEYDFPAMIDKALEVSGQSKLRYVGYSQGTLIGFAHFSVNQELASKIEHFYAMGPVATLKFVGNPLSLVAKYMLKPVRYLFSTLGYGELKPSKAASRIMSSYVCGWGTWLKNDFIQGADPCENVLYWFAGFESTTVNSSRMPVYMGHSPAPTSSKNFIHFGQMVRSGKFQKYDYGTASENRVHYGNPTPPTYDASQINVPVTLFVGKKDTLATLRDVWVTLRHSLPRLHKIFELPGFNHLDFMWSLEAKPFVYDVIINHAKGGRTEVLKLQKDLQKELKKIQSQPSW